LVTVIGDLTTFPVEVEPVVAGELELCDPHPASTTARATPAPSLARAATSP
jgi:hypothetical protein